MSELHTEKVKLKTYAGEIEVDVEFNFFTGEKGSRDEPGCDPYAEILAVKAGSVNILPLLEPDLIEAIGDRVCEGPDAWTPVEWG